MTLGSDPRWSAARRFLAVRLDNLGDVLVTTPALHAIKRSRPDVALTLLTSAVGAQVARLNPDLDDVIVHDAPWVDPWQRIPHDSEREQRLIAWLKARRFDAAVIFTSFRQSPLPAAYLCYLADIPLRLGATTDGAGSLLTLRHKPCPEHPEGTRHEVERQLDLVGAIGLDTDERRLVLQVPAEARAHLAGVLAARGLAEGPRPEGPLVVVHPGCTMPARTYPWEQFAAVAEGLVERLGATVLLTGAPDEAELVERVRARVGALARARVHALAGALPFPGFCALIEAADLVVTNNTGPMHLAAALRTPVVALFALTNPPEQWGPWQAPHRQLYHEVPCRLCYSRVCPVGHECLRLVTPAMVVDAARELLSAGQPAAATVGGA